jgi:RNA recognition motif-containing protein
VQNLPEGTDDEKLAVIFIEFGEILSANVKKAEDNTLTRTGFVCFKSEDSALKALNAMNRKLLTNGEYLIVS